MTTFLLFRTINLEMTANQQRGFPTLLLNLSAPGALPGDLVLAAPTDLSYDVQNGSSVAVDFRPRRPVKQRWFYEPRSTSVDTITPALSKRWSKPPQRLTASRFALMASSDSHSRVPEGVSPVTSRPAQLVGSSF
jgi:hypothetical protein